MKAKDIWQIVFKYGLAISIIVGFYWLMVNIKDMEPSAAMRDTFIMIAGVLVGKFGTIVDNEWGSSSGSKEKDKTIGEALNSKP